ncbi:MAG: protein kinase, partial [Myxococcales bacterium]|nr:protein kinase [Myxococcales bacterium]
LAEGGMGVVYRARHDRTGKLAALKVMERTDAVSEARFRREAAVSAEVGHPGIVDVFDADVDPERGCLFIAMELLEGRSLREFFDDPQASPGALLEMLLKLLAPLAAAHQRGFVHRDLKPENVFVIERGEGVSEIKLLDFGIAGQQEPSGLTRTGTCMGTPHYMSPEQAMSASGATPAADVWSVGVMIYEALAGHPPFDGDTGHAIVVRACTTEHEPLAARVAGVTAALSALVDRCLKKQPTERLANAEELSAALRQVLCGPALPCSRRPQRVVDGPPRRDPSGVRRRHEGLGDPPVVASISPGPLAVGSSLVGTTGTLGAAALSLFQLAPPHYVLGLGTSAAALAIVGALSLRKVRLVQALASAPPPAGERRSPRTENTVTMRLPTCPARGPSDAAVVAEIFADLSCVRTRRVAQCLERLRAEHQQQLRVCFHFLPRRDWPNAWMVSEALVEAFEQASAEGFWRLHDRIAAQRRRLTLELVGELAREEGLNMTSFTHALGVELHRETVAGLVRQAADRGIDEGPSIVLGDRVLRGDQLREENLRWALRDALRVTSAGESLPVRATEVARPGSLVGLRALVVTFKGARGAPTHIHRSRNDAKDRAVRLFARASMPDTDFSEVGLRFGDDLCELGLVAIEWLPRELRGAAARLEVAEVSEPIESERGFYIMQRYR